MDQYHIDNYTALVESKAYTWAGLAALAAERDDTDLADLCKQHAKASKVVEVETATVAAPENASRPAPKANSKK